MCENSSKQTMADASKKMQLKGKRLPPELPKAVEGNYNIMPIYSQKRQ